MVIILFIAILHIERVASLNKPLRGFPARKNTVPSTFVRWQQLWTLKAFGGLGGMFIKVPCVHSHVLCHPCHCLRERALLAAAFGCRSNALLDKIITLTRVRNVNMLHKSHALEITAQNTILI
jgi:hypothetical protein